LLLLPQQFLDPPLQVVVGTTGLLQEGGALGRVAQVKRGNEQLSFAHGAFS
jgi:hypothetical protein